MCVPDRAWGGVRDMTCNHLLLLRDKKAHKHHDLATGEMKTIGPRRVFTIAAGKYLRARLNGSW